MEGVNLFFAYEVQFEKINPHPPNAFDYILLYV
jgi:hypothetical protein